MHRNMFKIQDGVAIVEKLNCRVLLMYTEHLSTENIFDILFYKSH